MDAPEIDLKTKEMISKVRIKEAERTHPANNRKIILQNIGQVHMTDENWPNFEA